MAWQSISGAGKALVGALGLTASLVGGYTAADEHVCQKGRSLPLDMPFPCDAAPVDPTGSGASEVSAQADTGGRQADRPAPAISINATASPQLDQPLRTALESRLGAQAGGVVDQVDVAIGPASFQGERRYRAVVNFALAGQGGPQACSAVIDYPTAPLFGARASARIGEAVEASNRKGTITCS